MNKRIILVLVVICMMFIGKVNAQSNYYGKKWEYAKENEGYYEILSALDTDDGFLIVGSEKKPSPFIHRHDLEGNLVETIEVDPNSKDSIIKIISIDGGYLAFGVGDGIVFVYKLDEDYQIIDYKNYDVDLYIDYSLDIFVERIDDFVYIFNVNNQEIVGIIYSIDDDYFSDIVSSELSNTVRSTLDNYYKIYQYDTCNNTVSSDNPKYCSIFVGQYKGGYIFGLYDSTQRKSKLIYYKNKEVKWEKVFEGEYITDGIQYNDMFLFVSTKSDSVATSQELTLIDENAKKMETEIINDYIDNKPVFGFDNGKLHKVGKGFILSGTENICNPANMSYGSTNEVNKQYGDVDTNDSCFMEGLLYFESVYNVVVKENDHGKIKVSKTKSFSGELIDFTTEIDADYKLDKVIVTDAKGKAVEFKDNKFVMPDSDVTLELVLFKNVTIVEEVVENIVENPATATGVGAGLIILLVISGYYFFKHKKDITY